MALDAKEIARIIKEELEKLGEIQVISYVDVPEASPETVLGVETIDGHGMFVTVEPF